MGKPTQHELRQALECAIAMRESGNDPDFMAKSLLNLHYRLLRAERVMEAAKRYLHAGQDPSGHRELLQAVREAEEAGRDPESDDLPIIGRGPTA